MTLKGEDKKCKRNLNLWTTCRLLALKQLTKRTQLHTLDQVSAKLAHSIATTVQLAETISVKAREIDKVLVWTLLASY